MRAGRARALAAAALALLAAVVLMARGAVGEEEVAPDGSALVRGGARRAGRGATAHKAPRSNCVALGSCDRCSAEEIKWAATDPTCLGTGFKQEYSCVVARKRPEGCSVASGGGDASSPGADGSSSTSGTSSVSSGTLTAEACGPASETVNVFFACDPPGFDTSEVMYFEVCMAAGAAASLYVVWQRKIQAYERMSSILSNR